MCLRVCVLRASARTVLRREGALCAGCGTGVSATETPVRTPDPAGGASAGVRARAGRAPASGGARQPASGAFACGSLLQLLRELGKQGFDADDLSDNEAAKSHVR